ncbi:CPBP family intramembrane glutamic endopeptidase [Halohasta salina]|uniref:CPBP family intramembrane glutamic endopeptidase n=1 Tax=Halohasta salina TaxID=2961621 RepID=UPI0020A2E8CB|nr:CPBP family glutamic-type intramembrane protease [Halohasta salina]
MAQWSTFLGVVGVVVVLLLALTRASTATLDSSAPTSQPTSRSASDQPSVTDHQSTTDHPSTTNQPSAVEQSSTTDQPSTAERSPAGDERSTIDGPPTDERPPVDEQPAESTVGPAASSTATALSTPALLANVAVSQGVFAVLVVLMAWYTEIPAWAFGLAPESLTLGAFGTGLAVGVGLYLLNEAGAAVGRRHGLVAPTELRESLAPDTAAGWVLLLVVVLPIIAGFEELLFRGALIGVAAAGAGLPPWLLVVGSSVAFALGHGAQGRLGIVVTGLLGIGLGAVFVLSGSLLVVVVAHYVVNAAEFLVHERAGWSPSG